MDCVRTSFNYLDNSDIKSEEEGVRSMFNNTSSNVEISSMIRERAEKLIGPLWKSVFNPMYLNHHQFEQSVLVDKDGQSDLNSDCGVAICKLCNLMFCDHQELHQHLNSESHILVELEVKKPFKCDQCEKRFTLASSVKRHLQIHTGVRPYRCIVCGKGFSDSCNLRIHMRGHTGEKRFKCKDCDKDFVSAGALNAHSKTHSGIKRFKCVECGEAFAHQHSMQNHMMVFHTCETKFKCSICNKGFSRSDDLKRHMRYHSGDRPFKCTVCEKAFTESSELKRHMRIHTGEKPFKCVECDKGFTQSVNFKRHMRTHLEEKPFKCVECDVGFVQLHSLQSHIKIVHTGDAPFKCSVCNRGFTKPSDLKRHTRYHTGERPFVCNVCNKGFAEPSELKRHVRVHTGEKPFHCTLCNKGFRGMINLKSHLKTTHQLVNNCDLKTDDSEPVKEGNVASSVDIHRLKPEEECENHNSVEIDNFKLSRKDDVALTLSECSVQDNFGVSNKLDHIKQEVSSEEVQPLELNEVEPPKNQNKTTNIAKKRFVRWEEIPEILLREISVDS